MGDRLLRVPRWSGIFHASKTHRRREELPCNPILAFLRNNGKVRYNF